jgi:4-amino-4-deoxy-L-arabinose transferase-like glycosyltransferase
MKSTLLPSPFSPYYDLWLLITVSIAFYVFIPCFFGWDQAWYALHALSIFNGQGYVGPETGAVLPSRGPLYPLMIAASYFGGIDSRHAFWPAKFFAAITPLTVYWGGYLTGGRLVARVASILYMASIAANFSILRPIDNIWSVLALAATCVFIQALKRDSFVQSLASGILFGLAYLTKEAAVLLFPMPFLLCLGDDHYRNKRCFRLVLFSTVATAALPLAWLIYARSVTCETPALGDQGGIVMEYIFNSIITSPMAMFNLLTRMFVYPLSWLGLGPLLALLASFVLSRRHPAMRPIVAWTCCVAPLMAYIAMRNWHAGYYTPLYLMSFIAMGMVFQVGYEWFVARGKILAARAIICLLVVYVAFSITTPSLSKIGNYKKQSRLSLNPLIPSELLPSAVIRKPLANSLDDKNSIAIAGALKRLGINQAVVIPDVIAYSLAFISKGTFQPTLFSPAVCHGSFRSQGRYTGKISCSDTPFLFFLSKREEFEHYMINFSSQERLVATLRDHGPHLVVMDSNYVYAFDHAHWATRLAGTPDWGIYKVDIENITVLDHLFIGRPESKKNWVKLQKGDSRLMQNVIDQARQCLADCVDQNVLNAWIEMFETQNMNKKN